MNDAACGVFARLFRDSGEQMHLYVRRGASQHISPDKNLVIYVRSLGDALQEHLRKGK